MLLAPAWASSSQGRGTDSLIDAGAVSIMPPGDTIPPGPIFPCGTVHNYGDAAVQIPARLDIYHGDSLVYSSTDSAWVESGANGTITFEQWIAFGGYWWARLTTILAGDGNPANDTLSVQFLVWEPGHDVCMSIRAPIGVVDTLPKTPSARARNFGSYTETFPAHFQIRDSATGSLQYNDSVIVTALNPGMTADLDFPVWGGHHPGGRYYTKSWAALSEGNATDTARGEFQVLARIVDVGIRSFPSPAGSVDSGTIVTPSVQLHNYGNSPADLDVTVSINVSPAYLSTVSVTGLRPCIDTTVNTFAPWPAIQRGVWTARCSLCVVSQPSGDTVSRTVTVNVHDLGAKAIVVPVGGVPPITITPKARVRNYGTLREPCTVTFSINSTPPYADTKSLTGLPLGVDTVIDFAGWPASNGSYTARCSTYLANDQVPGNEVVTSDFQVDTIDVGVTAIAVPTGNCDTVMSITPSARVANSGSFPLSFRVFFTFNSSPAYSESVDVDALSASKESTVTFPTWAKPHAYGAYATLCSVYVAGDGNHSNDARTGSFWIMPGPDPAWNRMTDLPSGGRHKNTKDGGALSYVPGQQSDGYVYAFKGNNTCEFYRYSVERGTWASRDSIPAIGWSGKKKGVKKGSSLTLAGDGKLYATKGNNTCGFWQYDPPLPGGMRWTEMVKGVPTGGRACKEGTGSASVTVAGKSYVYLLKGSGTFEFYRYDVDASTWETMANAPAGFSNRPFRNGSSIAYDGGDTIYCLKGSYNEFFAYSISNDKWVTLDTLPRVAPPGTRKTKVKDGSGIAFMGRTVYALKGANTNEFWTYLCDSHRWYISAPMPHYLKNVKGGGALVAAPDNYVLFAFRGNNTLEFWECGAYGAEGLRLSADGQPKDVQGQSAVRSPHFALSIAPNPFTSSVNPLISYSLPVAGNVSLKLFDITGKLVSTLASGYRSAGNYVYRLSPTAHRLSSGIYLLKFESDGYTTTSKLIIE